MSRRYGRTKSIVTHALHCVLSLPLLSCSGEQSPEPYELPYFSPPPVSANSLPATPSPQPQTAQPPPAGPMMGFAFDRVSLSSNDGNELAFHSVTLYVCDSGFVMLREYESYDFGNGLSNSAAFSAGFVRSTGAVQGNPQLIADFLVSDRPADKQPFEGRFTITMANGTPARLLTSTFPGTIVDGTVVSVLDASAECIAEIDGLSGFCQASTGLEGAAAFCAQASQRGLL